MGLVCKNKGVKTVHIGKDVWRIGRDSIVDGKKHQVIYGPDDKNYHLWESDVDFVNTKGTHEPDPYFINGMTGEKVMQEPRRVNRDGNKAFESKTKIYILTNILDKKENWCFDLTKIPANGKLKVIYANGTVKNVEFLGQFTDVFIPYRWVEDKEKAERESRGNYIQAFGYRTI